ncbi:MAG: hypothetical protein QOJ09_1632 [Actinomycetota bacterium]|jgi:hypothetical protein|nr:hypothetical protein [Actinomycetota bacterium]
MPQPDYVPMTRADEVRPAERMPVPEQWLAGRPGEVVATGPPHGKRFGTPGPDQGFGLKLARHLGPRLQLDEHEHLDDAVAGCAAVGLKRAALWGRAPVVYDMELAYTLWGYLGAAPRELVEFRHRLFLGAHHEYWSQRDIADRVPDATLRLTPAEVATRLSDWRHLLDAS